MIVLGLRDKREVIAANDVWLVCWKLARAPVVRWSGGAGEFVYQIILVLEARWTKSGQRWARWGQSPSRFLALFWLALSLNLAAISMLACRVRAHVLATLVETHAVYSNDDFVGVSNT
jgi:hypothetical protein